MPELPEHGMIHLRSPHSAAETRLRLEAALAARGIPILAHIDHSASAADAGIAMPAADVYIFGNAKAGTPLMLAAPTLALDLPLKALVWEDAGKQVWVTYNTPEYLKDRHGFPENLMANIAGIRGIVEAAIAE
jgi:uncharacterized protein (DUF302 family)